MPDGTPVVKAFNTTFGNTLVSGEVPGEQLDVLIAGDDEAAKRKVSELVEAGASGRSTSDRCGGHASSSSSASYTSVFRIDWAPGSAAPSSSSGERQDGSRDPEEREATGAPATAELPASTVAGAVHLTVADLDHSVDYYAHAIGLEILERDHGRASLGVGSRELLGLVEEDGARPASGHTGLYHFALLVPRRVDLARWLVHAAREQVALVGLSDHFVSEALYLSDPDEHGIEIYWDRPRELWEGQVGARMTTLPLDVDDLLRELEGAGVGPVQRASAADDHGPRSPEGGRHPADA